MRAVVGISQKIRRAWLDALLDQLTRTTEEKVLRAFLDKHLENDLPGKESRAKCAGIVLRIWSGIPPERLSLRDRAVAMLPRISGQERLWLHWGMAALAYPFFRDTAEVVGRLLALQDDFTTAHVQGRMLTTWGDRATSKEATQKLITTLVDWEVLRSTKAQGHFLLTRRMKASVPDLQLWLLEALLGASAADEIEAQQLLRLPEAFPFALSIGIADLRRHEGFNIHRQGLDMDMVALRKVRLESPVKPIKKRTPETPPKAGQACLFDAQSEETADAEGGPDSVPAHRLASEAKGELRGAVDERHRNRRLTKSVVVRTQSDEATLSDNVRDHTLASGSRFAAALVECNERFREGHYLSCIALTQAILEALIRHIWKVQVGKELNDSGSFGANLEDLYKRNLINDEWKAKLDQMWADRLSIYNLCPSVESDRQNLEGIARNALILFTDLDQSFFRLSGRPS